MKSSEQHIPAKPPNVILICIIPLILGLFCVNVGRSIVERKYGPEAGKAAWAALLIIFIFLAVLYGKLLKCREAQRRRLLRERYQCVYRVLALPPELSTFNKHPLAKIEVGDYGWEAPPLADDGLIYLQGLKPDWGVVWHAGFYPDQIEKVGQKPVSQYDYGSVLAWVDPSPCPYPIVERETNDLGLPR